MVEAVLPEVSVEAVLPEAAAEVVVDRPEAAAVASEAVSEVAGSLGAVVGAFPAEVAARLPIWAAASPDAGVESFPVTVASIGLATIMAAAGIPTSMAAITTGILTATVFITTTMADATWFVGV